VRKLASQSLDDGLVRSIRHAAVLDRFDYCDCHYHVGGIGDRRDAHRDSFPETALDLRKKRYASGEVTKDEFDVIKRISRADRVCMLIPLGVLDKNPDACTPEHRFRSFHHVTGGEPQVREMWYTGVGLGLYTAQLRAFTGRFYWCI